jgi:hypothetical protein
MIMQWDNESIAETLNAKGGVVRAPAVVRYVAGCMKRERERLAKILEGGGTPAAIAAAIRDDSEDPQVFRWAGPASTSSSDKASD